MIQRVFTRLSLFILLPCMGGNILSARQVNDSLFAFIRSLPYDDETISELLNLSDSLSRPQPQNSFFIAAEAQIMADSLNEQELEAQAYSTMGTSSWYLGNYQQALAFHLEAKSRYLALGDSLGFARSSYDIANVYWRYGNYSQAMDNMIIALRIREDNKDSVAIADSYYGMGILQADLEDFDHALENYDHALEIATELGDKQRIANVLNMIGRAWRKQEIYDKAIEAHQKSVEIYREIGDEVGLSDYYNNMGSIYRRQGNYDQALDHFFEALDIQKRLNDQEGLADGYNDIGTTLTQKGNYTRAIDYLNRGLNIAQRTGLKDDVRYAYASLAAAYDSIGNYAQAYRYYQLATAVRDSLVNAQVNEQVAQLHIQYESDKKQQQIDLLKAASELRDERIRRNGIIAGAIALILLVFGASMVYRSRLQSRLNRKLAQKNRIIALEKERSDELLLNILPREIADELKLHGKAKARSYPEVTVMFIDFKNFTKIAENLTPRELVRELHTCFEMFDRIVKRHGLEKIKTIGDAYMCAGGLPVPNSDHATATVRAGLEIQDFMNKQAELKKKLGEPYFEARMGIHTGSVIAGIVGIHKFVYDIWGDAVNVAARLETSGLPGKVNVSQATFEKIQEHFICKHRGKVRAKNKGQIDMYFIEWEI